MANIYSKIREGVYDCLGCNSKDYEERLFDIVRGVDSKKDVSVSLLPYDNSDYRTEFIPLEPTDGFKNRFWETFPEEDVHEHAKYYPEDDVIIKFLIRNNSFDIKKRQPRYIIDTFCVFPEIEGDDYEIRFDIRRYKPKPPTFFLKPVLFLRVPDVIKENYVDTFGKKESINGYGLVELHKLTKRLNKMYLNYKIALNSKK